MLIGKNWMKTATFAMVGDHWRSLADQGDGKGESCGKRETIAVNPSYVSPGQNKCVDC